MNKSDKIFIAGHRGLVGSSITEALQNKGYTNLILKKRSELDLLDQASTAAFFEKEEPDYVVLAAAKVGGIWANSTFRADFIFENLQIQNNIIHQSWLHGVKKLLFLGSSCIYPKNAQVPIKESSLLTSPLEYSNEPYAIAKIAGLKCCESYNLQYGTNFIAAMPTNLYGYADNFDLETSHVLPAFIRKFHLANLLWKNDFTALRKDLERFSELNFDTPERILEYLAKHGIKQEKKDVIIELWGSGKPFREFMFAEDLARASVYLLENINFDDLVEISCGKNAKEIRNTHINIGTGEDISIKDLATLVARICNFHGQIAWDNSKPDGTMHKTMDVTKLNKLGFKAETSLEEGINKVYQHYLKQ